MTDGALLYIVRDNGVVFCLDAKSGAVVYGPARLPSATYSASAVLAAGKIYVTNEDVTAVLRAGTKFELLATNDLDEYTLSSIAVSGGWLFLRTDAALYAIGAPSRRRPIAGSRRRRRPLTEMAVFRFCGGGKTPLGKDAADWGIPARRGNGRGEA